MLLLQTGCYEQRGGVQTYMLRIAEILTEFTAVNRERLSCVSLGDGPVCAGAHANPVEYAEFLGARGSKLRFVGQVLRAVRGRRHRVAIVGHLHLAPVAHLLQRAGLIERYVVVLHGMEAWVKASALVRNACRKAFAIVATTRYTAAEFQVQNGFGHPRIATIPLATCERSGRAVAEDARRAFEILTVTRLDASDSYKGTDHLIEATAALNRQGTDARLRIVGSGNHREYLSAKATSLGAGSFVEFTGGVPSETLHDLYAQCDVFALPSRMEGFGLVFLEAMSAGKPCVGGRHGGTPEVIRDGVDGYLVEHGDVPAIAERLGRLASNRDERRAMGRRALERVRTEFLYTHMRDRWLSLLNRVSAS